jgi:hypothetical protein
MTRTSSIRRWAVPALSAGVVAAVAAAPHAVAASAHPTLPARSAATLLADIERSHVQAFSGTVRVAADLGLPSLPDSFAGAGTGLQTLLSGAHTLRVWADGPDRQRVALLGDLDEYDVIRSGSTVWTWSSSAQTATRQTVGTGAGATGSEAGHRTGATTPDPVASLTPQAQAEKALKAIDPTTAVSVDRTARVAGRAAYQLVLQPRTNATLVGSVRIAVDAATSLPLRVQIFAVGRRTPALQVGFTALHLSRPSAAAFHFAVPRGAKLATGSPLGGRSETGSAASAGRDSGKKPTTVGSGWTSVLVLPAGSVDLSATSSGQRRDTSAGALIDQITATVPQGRLLTTRLLSVLFTRDGRVLLGAVPAATLEQVAGG